MIGCHCLINGHVQGVGYRMAARQQAESLDINGWVRNLPDGRVEMWLEGDEQRVEEMLDWAHQGPRFAGVTRIDKQHQSATEKYQDFSIR